MNHNLFLRTQKVLSKITLKTPLIFDEYLSNKMDAKIFMKAESLQRTGSFKIRGAYNYLYNMKRKNFQRGVLAWSSGNHAQGVAEAAKIFNIKATIVMPKDAPKNKIEGTLRRGAKIIYYNRKKENREELARDIANKYKLEIIPPYDDPFIITGQGTVGVEIDQQLKEYHLKPDIILVPTGGGGLISGIASYIKNIYKNTKIFSVEPFGFEDHAKSFEKGKRIKNKNQIGSICDSLLVDKPGRITFEINKKLIHKGLVVTDNEVLMAMRYALTNLGLALEPGGAVALAALIEEKIKFKGKTIIIVLSGSNVDPLLLKKCI